MKSKERLLWIFVLGLLLGFLIISVTEHQKSESSALLEAVNPKPNSQDEFYSFLSLAYDYLQEQYIYAKDLNKDNLLNGAISGMYQATGDSYTTFLPPEVFKDFNTEISGKLAGIGVYLQKLQTNNYVSIFSFMPDSPAIKAGLKIGDQIVSINEIPTHNFSVTEVGKKIQGEENSWLFLEIYRSSTQTYHKIKCKRSILALPSVYTEKIKNIGYIKIKDFTDNTDIEVETALKTLSFPQSLILDLRDNLGGQIEPAINIANFFLKPKNIITSIINNKQEETIYYTKKTRSINYLSIPIILLINNNTASAAEILAAALKDNNRATLVGEKSVGKASIQSIFPINFKKETYGLKITIAHYLTPLKQDINHIGISPHYIIKNPDISLKDYETIDTIINQKILQPFIEKPSNEELTPEKIEEIQTILKKQNLDIPTYLLKKVIKEQKDKAEGKIDTIEWDFDKQLAKAIDLLKNKLYK